MEKQVFSISTEARLRNLERIAENQLATIDLLIERLARMESVFNAHFKGEIAGPVETIVDPELNGIEIDLTPIEENANVAIGE